MNRRVHWPTVIVALCTVAAAASVWFQVFEPTDLAVPLAASLIVPFAVVAGTTAAGRTLPSAAALAVAIMGWVVVELVLVVPLFDVTSLVGGIVNGWLEILTSSIPAPPKPSALVVPTTLAWVASYVTVELVVRTRCRLLVLLPSVLLLVSALAFSLDGPGRSLPAAIVFTALAATLLLLRVNTTPATGAPVEGGGPDDAEDASLRRRRILTAVPLVLAFGVLGPLIGSALPFVSAESPLQLRDYVNTDDRVSPDQNPLGRVSQAAAQALLPPDAPEGAEVVFDVTVDAPVPGVARFPLVTLDTFDGVEWTATSDFRATGAVVSANRDADGSAVGQDVTRYADADSWLPALQRPVRLDVPLDADVQADQKTGTLVSGPAAPAEIRYRVESVVTDAPPPQQEQIAVDEEAIRARTPFAGVPEQVALLANSLGKKGAQISPDAGVSGAWNQAATLADFLIRATPVEPAPTTSCATNKPVATTPFVYSKPAEVEPGHSFVSICRFLFDTRNGTNQHYAASFVVLARSMGLPARIVVGFSRPGDQMTVGQPVQFRERDLTAWPEVKFAQTGWYPFAITNVTDEAGNVVTQPEEPEISQQDQPADAGEQGDAGGDNRQDPAQGDEQADAPLPLWARTAIGGGAVLAVLLLVAAVPWFVKRRRRRRRRTQGPPEEQIAGAWSELVDRLHEAGVAHPTSMTSAQVAELAGDRFGESSVEAVTAICTIVDRSAHGRTPPTPEDSVDAWRFEEAVEKSVRRSLPTRRRIVAAFDPRTVSVPARPGAAPPDSLIGTVDPATVEHVDA